MTTTPITQREPVVTYVSVGAGAGLILSGLTVWGLHLDPTQQAWLGSVVAFVSPVLAAFLARRKVAPVE